MDFGIPHTSKEVEEISAWLQKHASEMNVKARPHPEFARRDDDWIYLPVRIQGTMGAFERARRLQELEDAWQEKHAKSGLHLLLIPAAK